MAHPVRIALLEALTREGPLTATEAAELLGESPANCSFHLRTLAKYGFVEEADGGTGRARPWRRVSLGQSLDMVYDDTETTIAAHALAAVHHERIFARLRTWEAQHASYPREWQASAFADTTVAYITADELRDIEEEIEGVLTRYRDRTLDKTKRPADAAPVSLVAIGHPLPPSPSGN